jgi:predicted RNA-binding Zn-ribbon protein involved in translation (DUF1610 family)
VALRPRRRTPGREEIQEITAKEELMNAIPKHASFLLSYCLLCQRLKHDADRLSDLCTSCDEAIDHIHVANRDGACPVCGKEGQLYTSDYYSADYRWCHKHAVVVSLRHIERNDTDHAGDVRNVA